MERRALLTAASLVLAWQSLLFAQAGEGAGVATGDNPIVEIVTSKGVIVLELWPADAPLAVENFLHYVDAGFYNDTIFHRVIEDTLIQGGGLSPELTRKIAGPAIKIESDNGRLNLRGTLAMARGEDKDSATSEFYINLKDNPEFDPTMKKYGYTVFGQVIDGMPVADRIGRVQTSRRGSYDDIPILPIFVETVRRAAPKETP